MLTLTERAVRLLSQVIERDESSDRAVRIVARGDGWMMQLDRERSDDHSFEHEGRTILLLDPGVAEALEERTLDVHGSKRGWKLRLA